MVKLPQEARIELAKAWGEGYRALAGMHAAVVNSGLDHTLKELVFIRASQINGCAFCLDMHTKDARAAGETEQRIFALNAWRDTDFFTEQERAVLALTEAITLVTEGHVPDDVFDNARKHFDEEGLAKVIMAIVLINAWNRTGVTQRSPVGGYRPPAN
ncbi:carboxymuconolactone decarboxylase family protein [Saccharopolyspora erythraea]|uniref:carboxymuconolactone decarboxylase family protein n=1 Tax=Saccharopolyspora erythraea TaxID=1836 RepID=UPI001BABE9E9|nr:carboxymuconolactone decarboxylase family protein [Saccharopolyspora erythraea]QUH02573.1 carboxymuconolactone decarboxylase family protein [Saccharopolyspora erythraea]